MVATFYPLRGKKIPSQRRRINIETPLVNFHTHITHLLCNGTNKYPGTRWERWKWMGVKDSSRLQGCVFINGAPHILFRSAAALPRCSLLMPHSCNQEQDSNTCCFHHAQLFGRRRMAPLAPKQRWTRCRNSPRGLFPLMAATMET